MVFRNVERGEVIEIRLDLAVVFNHVAERDEDVFETFAQQRDRMPVTETRPSSRQSDVETLARRAFVLNVVFETLLRLVQRLDERRFGRLHELSECSTLLGSNAPDQLLRGCECARSEERRVGKECR